MRRESQCTTPPSASKKKLNYSEDGCSSAELNPNSKGFVIVDLNLLSELIKQFTKCRYCDSVDVIELDEHIGSRRGLASKISLQCKNCGETVYAMTSETTKKKYENIRLAYGMRCIGKGQTAAQTLCAVMNLPPPPVRFLSYYSAINESLKNVTESSMKCAALETVAENDGDKDIAAAFDASWQKRGHSSLNGVVTATALDNGKVIDFECKSKFCMKCKLNIDHHCTKNYEGYSGGMESEGVISMYKRSIEFHNGVRYTKYLGDGDSKGHSKVSESKVYGSDVHIEKMECVGHVQKRMGCRLRKLVRDMKGKKLDDGKGLTGRGRLTEAEMKSLQHYYGEAIRRNANAKDVTEMRRDIWATFFHKLSTNDNPQHALCPKGNDSWCAFQKAVVEGTTYDHKHSLPQAVMEAIKPVYKDLSNQSLLIKCLYGRTQNPNESFNNCIWERIPKNVFVSLETLKIGVMDAVICFNNGTVKRCNVFENLGLYPGNNMQIALRLIDKQRVREAEKHCQDVYKEARVRKNIEKRKR